jgi:hypothetical protein
VPWLGPALDRPLPACPLFLTTTQSPRDRRQTGRPDRDFYRTGRRFRREVHLLLILLRPVKKEKARQVHARVVGFSLLTAFRLLAMSDAVFL